MKKGETLVEVLVALAVFTVTCAAVFACLAGIRRVAHRQEESVRFEMICRDIGYFESRAALEDHYFAGKSVENNGKRTVSYWIPLEQRHEANRQILDDLLGMEAYPAVGEYYVNQEGYLVVSVYNNRTGKTVIDQLIYGGIA